MLSWAILGPFWGILEALGGVLGPLGGDLETSWSILGPFSAQTVSSCFKLFQVVFKLFQVVFKLFQVAAASWGHLGAFGGSWEALACFFGLLLKHGSSFTKTFKNQRKSRVFGGF